MALLGRRAASGQRVLMIAPERISPNPDQPRQYFDSEGLAELAESIRLHGILQPLSVRRREAGDFELIAGERRLRAAMLCGLREVPCLLSQANRETSALLALIENLQRRELDFLEEAYALERLIEVYELSQEEAAAKLGKSQSTVANKLRLLRLPAEVLEMLRRNGYTERHARALLRLPTAEAQREAAREVIGGGWTVARTERYVLERLELHRQAGAAPPQLSVLPPPKGKKRRPVYLIRDVRFFLNSIENGLSIMQSAGVRAECKQEDAEDAIFLTIRIPK